MICSRMNKRRASRIFVETNASGERIEKGEEFWHRPSGCGCFVGRGPEVFTAFRPPATVFQASRLCSATARRVGLGKSARLRCAPAFAKPTARQARLCALSSRLRCAMARRAKSECQMTKEARITKLERARLCEAQHVGNVGPSRVARNIPPLLGLLRVTDPRSVAASPAKFRQIAPSSAKFRQKSIGGRGCRRGWECPEMGQPVVL
jgi:hypothetical protein